MWEFFLRLCYEITSVKQQYYGACLHVHYSSYVKNCCIRPFNVRRGKKNHRKLLTLIKLVYLEKEKLIVRLPETCIYFSFIKNIEHFLSFATAVRNFQYSYYFTVKVALFFVKITETDLFSRIEEVMLTTH